jgi:hypothetical protein
MRDSTIFYRSFYEAISELTNEQQGIVYNAIFNYALNSVEPELIGIAKTVFTLIKPQLDANNKRFENGSKGGRPKQTETKTKPNNNQNKTKTEPNNNNNVNNNVNVNNNIEQRKQEFAQDMVEFSGKYNREMMVDFYEYWTEHGKNDKKMRFEKQASFDLGRRLKTWERNQKPEQDEHHDPLVEYVKKQLGDKYKS